MAEKIMSAKKCRRDTMILLFTLAITLAFGKCRCELERLNCEKQIILSMIPNEEKEE